MIGNELTGRMDSLIEDEKVTIAGGILGKTVKPVHDVFKGISYGIGSFENNIKEEFTNEIKDLGGIFTHVRHYKKTDGIDNAEVADMIEKAARNSGPLHEDFMKWLGGKDSSKANSDGELLSSYERLLTTKVQTPNLGDAAALVPTQDDPNGITDRLTTQEAQKLFAKYAMPNMRGEILKKAHDHYRDIERAISVSKHDGGVIKEADFLADITAMQKDYDANFDFKANEKGIDKLSADILEVLKISDTNKAAGKDDEMQGAREGTTGYVDMQNSFIKQLNIPEKEQENFRKMYAAAVKQLPSNRQDTFFKANGRVFDPITERSMVFGNSDIDPTNLFKGKSEQQQ